MRIKENNNIKNWLALSKEGNYITIDKVKDIKQDYFCPCCNEVLRGRALQSEVITPHFYHLQNDNLNSCNYENAYKRYWKDNLITVGEIIKLPHSGNIVCVDKELNYKINDELTADIKVITDKNKTILFTFTEHKGNFKNINNDVFYVNFLNLEINKSNLNYCVELIHSVDIDNSNNKLKSKIEGISNNFENILKVLESKCDIDINKFEDLATTLMFKCYDKEHMLMINIITSLKNREITKYKYKNNIIEFEEVNRFRNLINNILHTTNYNIDLDINKLKRIDYNIYKDSKWSKSIYFDYIKDISTALKEHIKTLEDILN